MNIQLMKRIDATLGRLLTSILPPPLPPSPPATPKNILVIRPGGIGDAVLLAPTLITLKRQFPESHLTVLAEKRNAGILGLIPEIDQVFRYDILRELIQIFHHRYDVILDTEQYHRLSAGLSRVLFAKLRIGFATNERARLFHAQILYSHDEYEAESFLHLLAPMGIQDSFTGSTPFLKVPASVSNEVVPLLESWGKYRLVALFPGASIPERRWGTDNFNQVARHLSDFGYAVVVVGGKEDAASGDAIIRMANGCNLAGQTTLVETAAVLNRATLLISGDSGVLHIGVGLGVPTIALFGPGIARKWGPQGKKNIILNKGLPCSPCTRFGYTAPCMRGTECLQSMKPQEVITAADLLLSGSEKPISTQAST